MNNTMDKLGYVKANIVWAMITFLWCKSIFFRCLQNYTYKESLLILVGIIIFVEGFGIRMTWNYGRNYINVFENIVLFWGVFVVLAYSDIYRERMVFIGILTLLVTIAMLLLMLHKTNRINSRNGRLRRKCIMCMRRNATVGMLCLMLPLGMSVVVHGTYLNSEMEITKVYGDEFSLDNNIEQIANIDPERWEKLDIQQRLNTSQAIIHCEARYLGISHEIVVGTRNLGSGNLACYNESQHQIIIDTTHLMSSSGYDVCKSLIHEMAHVYQYEQVALYRKLDEKSRNLLMFRNVSIYAQEFADYQDGDENYWEYYGQKIEEDARSAAEIGVLEYIERINGYLKKED